MSKQKGKQTMWPKSKAKQYAESEKLASDALIAEQVYRDFTETSEYKQMKAEQLKMRQRQELFDALKPVAERLFPALVAGGTNPAAAAGQSWVFADLFLQEGVKFVQQGLPFADKPADNEPNPAG